MKECKRLKCPKNKGLQGFARVRKRAKALPNNEEFKSVNRFKCGDSAVYPLCTSRQNEIFLFFDVF